MNVITFLNHMQNFSLLVFVLAHSGLAVTKTHNGMDSGTLCNLPVINSNSGLGIPKSKFLGFREGYCMASW